MAQVFNGYRFTLSGRVALVDVPKDILDRFAQSDEVQLNPQGEHGVLVTRTHGRHFNQFASQEFQQQIYGDALWLPITSQKLEPWSGDYWWNLHHRPTGRILEFLRSGRTLLEALQCGVTF